MADGRGGSAQTLRDYWSGHGHPGPSHGRERDEIAWGTDGDFMRCVAQVTAHGHMTEEEAKGYCNLRHHEATGMWPAQHAKKGQGVDLLTKAADGSGEARVPAGHVTGGQFTVGGDGPTKTPPKPNPYGKKGKKGSSGPGSKDKSPKARRAALRKRISGLESRLSALLKEERSLQGSGVSGRASTRTGTRSSAVSSSARSSTAQSSSSKPSSARPGSAAKPKPSKLSQVQSQIRALRGQIRAARQQLAAIKAWEGDVNKSSRSVREKPTGRFRTFEGESKEAATAFQEGRVTDAVDLLGSARALATEPGHRTMLDHLQRHIARTQHVVPDTTKGFIRGDSIAHGGKTGFHEGSAGSGHVYLRTRDGVRHRVPAHQIRATSDEENEDLYRQETDPGLPEKPEDADAKVKR